MKIVFYPRDNAVLEEEFESIFNVSHHFFGILGRRGNASSLKNDAFYEENEHLFEGKNTYFKFIFLLQKASLLEEPFLHLIAILTSKPESLSLKGSMWNESNKEKEDYEMER